MKIGLVVLIVGIGWLALGGSAAAQIDTPARRAEQAYLTNRIWLQQDQTNAEAAWQLSRACFKWAEFAVEKEKRAQIAGEGIDAARLALERKPGSAEAHHWLAMNLGQLARTKKLGALKLVQEMEREFKAAIELDEEIEHGGPQRCLGHLYREAPGWPTSLGNKQKARTHLARAVAIAPDFPENRIILAEAFVKWGDKRALATEIEALREVIPKARERFQGDAWTADWADWNERWAALQREADEHKLRKPAKRGD